MKKILILGGKPIGSVELVRHAKDMGLYTIVSDYLPIEYSPAKQIADEVWDISTADVDLLFKKCKVANVKYITTGVHEFNINRMLELSERLAIPCYCTKSTWKYCDDKMAFKTLCRENDIPIAKTYQLNDINIEYPVITKPVDGSGSRGFHVCNTIDELLIAYKDSKSYSPTNNVLIEQYIPYNAVIIHYTMLNGKCYYSGMSDKQSVTFENSGASVMGIQTFPSKGEEIYLQLLNARVSKMFESAGFVNGPIWIESFYDGDKTFVFNEMGYRFGGSLTYFPVKYFYGIDQLDLFIKASVGQTLNALEYKRKQNLKSYCILPVHIQPGIVNQIIGLEQLNQIKNFYAIVPVHHVGDKIEAWGSAQQVFCYVHMLYDSYEDLTQTIHNVLNTLKVTNINGNNMLYTLFNIDSL